MDERTIPSIQRTGTGGLGSDERAPGYQGDLVPEREITVTDAGHNHGRPIMNDPEIMRKTDPMIKPVTPQSAPGDPKREQMHKGPDAPKPEHKPMTYREIIAWVGDRPDESGMFSDFQSWVRAGSDLGRQMLLKHFSGREYSSVIQAYVNLLHDTERNDYLIPGFEDSPDNCARILTCMRLFIAYVDSDDL